MLSSRGEVKIHEILEEARFEKFQWKTFTI